ncbi:MBL fold metallo-hydrolase [Methylobacterium sp. J-078]|jgi:glyoxylase-like metal-dependent hydrolase (beta-lactamase superfamily II)|uniref:MBL fold metallo-hydrolase n=1 Tax=Methylobacterium sp. J-078 TaxID=2836657 RepID=UPI001FB8EBEA|nr:MBL fold metallo-hydrolase [Methylobacterium sp. J-078]MCJ2046841.1 MBL fold metallo-hydrolase [Methylobacterium sp. J-078]
MNTRIDRRSSRSLMLALSLTFPLLGPAPAQAQNSTPFEAINAAAKAGPINVHPLRGGVSMLDGSGGNITALPGPEGFFLVDVGIAVSKAMILDALRSIGPGGIRLAIVTHWHWDHADGAGWVRAQGASIMADPVAISRQEETIRVVEWGNTFRPKPVAELPNLSVAGDKTLYENGETIRIRHYTSGHTDGDISVYFVNADVLATGDTFWNGQYPFIDYVGGGSIDGAITAADANIAMSTAHTIIVPGHGPVGDLGSQTAFRDMLVTIRNRVAALKQKGMTLEQVQAAEPTKDHDAAWGRSIISGKLFTALVYRGV